ncbi:MAG: hypothetical protein NWF05_00345 [Candidatus Bathyarchaeota archaeon]|nr:hypothetical protein [Candidatus Bathyarchaeota archaeon]
MQAQNPKGQTRKETKKLGKDRLERVIDMMKGIEGHTVDPFLLNVDEIIRIIQEYFPTWDQPEELTLDAEAIHHLASVIKLQSEWVKQRSTSLYTDPFLLEEKITQKNKREITQIFLQAWHPIVEQEQITLRSLADALRYWDALVPLRERWEQPAVTEIPIGIATREELADQSILRDEAFSAELERYWSALQTKTQTEGKDGKLHYMDWVSADTYEETVHRAYITSFLVTYGYATLEVIPLEEEIFVMPLQEPSAKLHRQAVSVPITLSFESWQKWKRGEKE